MLQAYECRIFPSIWIFLNCPDFKTAGTLEVYCCGTSFSTDWALSRPICTGRKVVLACRSKIWPCSVFPHFKSCFIYWMLKIYLKKYLTHITNPFSITEKRRNQSFFHINPARSTNCRMLYAPPLTHSPRHRTLHHHQHK